MDRRTKQTKKKIKDAVIEKLKTDKFKDLSVTEITKTCKINRNTFYIHYRTVGDVILDIVDDVYNSFIKAFDDNSIKDYINCPRLLIYRASNVLIHDEMVSSLFYNSTFFFFFTAEIENRLSLYFYQKLRYLLANGYVHDSTALNNCHLSVVFLWKAGKMQIIQKKSKVEVLAC